MRQFLVDLQRENFSFQCAFPQISSKGTMEISGRGMNLRATILAQPNHLNGPYVIDFSLVKRTVEQLCKQHTEKVLVPSKSTDFTIQTDNASVTIQRHGSIFAVPKGEVVLIPVESITPAALAQYLSLALVKMLGTEVLNNTGIVSLTLHVDNGEYSAGFEYKVQNAHL